MIAELLWTGVVFAAAFWCGSKFKTYEGLRDEVRGWMKRL
jgi:hypothetical protein